MWETTISYENEGAKDARRIWCKMWISRRIFSEWLEERGILRASVVVRGYRNRLKTILPDDSCWFAWWFLQIISTPCMRNYQRVGNAPPPGAVSSCFPRRLLPFVTLFYRHCHGCCLTEMLKWTTLYIFAFLFHSKIALYSPTGYKNKPSL